MGTRSTSGTKPTPERVAEFENAQVAAEDITRRGETDRRCLTCGGELVMEEHGTSYLIRCKKEDRIISKLRGI
jgi:hypothetical protein